MTVKELIDAARKRVVTDADIVALKEVVMECDARFAERQRARAVTPELLERTYTL